MKSREQIGESTGLRDRLHGERVGGRRAVRVTDKDCCWPTGQFAKANGKTIPAGHSR